MEKKIQTDFLFAQPSFVSGMARTLDLFGVLDEYNYSSNPSEADAKAMASDWLIVGQDILDVIEQHPEERAA